MAYNTSPMWDRYVVVVKKEIYLHLFLEDFLFLVIILLTLSMENMNQQQECLLTFVPNNSTDIGSNFQFIRNSKW